MPKIVDKEQMRQTILRASLRAFLNDGIHKTTMDKIAKEAGIAKGTLYLYFKSKEGVIETITHQYFESLKNKLLPQQLFDTPDKLLSHLQTIFTMSEEEDLLIPVIIEAFGLSFSTSTLLDKYNLFIKETSTFYATNLQYFLDKELINKDLNPKIFSQLLVSMMNGMMLNTHLFQTENSNQQERIQELIKLLEGGLKA